MISVLWEVKVSFIFVTLLSKELTAEASALVLSLVNVSLEAAKASNATLSVTGTHWVPVHLLGVFLLSEVSIQRFCTTLSASLGWVELKITLPLSLDTVETSSKLFFNTTKSVDCEVIFFSTASTLLVREATALESAFVVKAVLFSSACFNASVATLSDTATQETPFHILGVFLPPEVSIHKLLLILSSCGGSLSE